MLAAGIVFMLEWEPLVHHAPVWDTGDDLWGIFRAAHYVGWGWLGGVYTPSNSVVSFPGLPILLAPVAMLTGFLHLSESDTQVLVAHPSAALVLQPVVLLLTSTVVFAVDALAQRIDVSMRQRLVLTTLVAIIAWPIASVWGHPEDALAMTFALYAMVNVLDGRWARCGWLLGVGILMQPLVAMLVPLVVGAAPPGRRLFLVIRSAVLSLGLVTVAYVGNPAGTYQMLVKQPTQPYLNHATPWVALAPRLDTGSGGAVAGQSATSFPDWRRLGSVALALLRGRWSGTDDRRALGYRSRAVRLAAPPKAADAPMAGGAGTRRLGASSRRS